MTMEEKVKMELFVRLSEGECLVNKQTHSPADFSERDKRTLYRLQIEIKLLTKIFEDGYGDIDENTLELADKIMLAEV